MKQTNKKDNNNNNNISPVHNVFAQFKKVLRIYFGNK